MGESLSLQFVLVGCGAVFSSVVGDGSKGVLQLSFGINVVCKAQLLCQVTKDNLWMETGEKWRCFLHMM